MMIRRVMTGAAMAAAMLVPAVALAGEGYGITFPQGWSAAVDGDIVSVTMPDDGDQAGTVVCNSQLNHMATMDGFSQGDLNDYASGVWTSVDWANLLGVDKSKVVVVETKSKAKNGLYFRTGLLRLLPGAFPNQTAEVDVMMGLYLLPGRIVQAGCYAVPADFDDQRPTFETTINSLKPQ